VSTREASLEKRVEQLERLVESLIRQRAHPHVADVARRHERLAMTIEPPGSDEYPSQPANVFPFVFVDVTFTREAGQQTITKAPHATTPQGYAATLCGEYVGPSTLIFVHEQGNRHFVITQVCGSGPGSLALAKLAQAMHPEDDCVEVECVFGTCESITTVANPARMVAESGDIVWIAKVRPCETDCGGSGGNDCLSLSVAGEGSEECQDASPCEEVWAVVVPQPREFCPVTNVEERETCLVEEHSKFYGWWDPERETHAEKIADLVDCTEGSGSQAECDLASGWTTGCQEGS
jgi:hypothetical protein